MVKFITKSVCMALIAMLCVGVNAQNAPEGSKIRLAEKANVKVNAQDAARKTINAAPMSKSPQLFKATKAQHAPARGRDVVLSEGFESGTTPTGWKFEKTGSGDAWVVVDALQEGEDGPIVVTPHSGDYFATNLWNGAGPRNAWMLSSGFTLTAGTEYTISFWLGLQGFQTERDKFKVCLGDAQTTAAMESGTTIYDNPGTSTVATWTKMEFTHTPTATGTYYLGFHAYSDANMGNDIDIDDIEIVGNLLPGDCDDATNLVVSYTEDCQEAKLTWSDPSKGRSTVLWDNTNINIGSSGMISTYWGDIDNWVWCADDFEADDVWVIEKVYSMGFSATSGNPNGILPTKMAIVIYENGSNNKPGTEIYRSTDIPITDGSEPVITLPEPFTLPSAGKYWMAIAGSYDTESDDNEWYVYLGTAQIGYNAHLTDPVGYFGVGAGWTDLAQLSYYSLYFKIEGTVQATPSDFTYNIYRDGNLIQGNYNATSYTDAGFDKTEGHTWSVKVACDGGGESNPVSATLDACAPPNDECNPAEITVALAGDDAIKIDWTYTAKRSIVTITQSYDPGDGVIGSTGSLSFGVYNRFRPEDLAFVNGGKLVEFVFIPGMGSDQGGEPRHNYTIRIYQGGEWSDTPSERKPGTLIYSQALDNANLDFDSGMDNIITLDEPVIIDASQEMWMGYWCQATAPGGYPALTDYGPRKAGLGDVMNYQGWTTLADVVASSPYNWYMQGRVEYTPPTVDIYRDGSILKSGIDGLTTTYTDGNLAPETKYCYYLVVNCTNGVTSDPSNEACETTKGEGINELSNSVAIYPNPTSGTITITADNFSKVEIYNTVGQLIETKTVDTFDIASYNTGIYFFKVYDVYNNNVTKRVMVAK